MTRRRWIADEVAGNRAALIGEHADHLTRVLRARVGQEFDISTGTTVRHGRISAIHDGRVEFELGEILPATRPLQLILALAIFKFDRMEWAIEKCTELGVSSIVPVIACRSDAHLVAGAAKRVERWRRIAREASEQSRRAAPPEIVAPINVEEAIALPGATRILLSEVAAGLSLKDALRAHSGGALALAIGPEGGWTVEEQEKFQESGWTAASLGNSILRAETAAIAALAIVGSELQNS